MKQVGIIFTVAFLGEVCHLVLPFAVPASIYGLCLMMFFLLTDLIKLEEVEVAAHFFIEIMPFMFIPAAVGVITSWEKLRANLFPFIVIIVSTTLCVMIFSGKVTDKIMTRREEHD